MKNDDLEQQIKSLIKELKLAKDTKMIEALKQQIIELNAQLSKKQPIQQSKNVIQNATLKVGGNAQIGDIIHIHSDVQKEKNSDRRFNKYINVIIVTVSIFLVFLIWFFNSSKPSINNSEKQPIDNPSNASQGLPKDTVIILSESQANKKEEITKIKEKPTRFTFHIQALNKQSIQLLGNELQKQLGWVKREQSKANFKIELTHSGDFLAKGDGYFYYSGGYVQIKMNEQSCCCDELSNLKIHLGDSRSGNRKQILEEQLSKQMQQLIHQNINDVIQQIKICTQ